jgi:hypothetical protein
MYEYYVKQIIFSQIYVVDGIAVIVECCAWLSTLFMLPVLKYICKCFLLPDSQIL